MSASFASALHAASDAAASQHYPAGTLYIVATPIGNLCDISLRALHVLGLVDAIACEDTRHTQALLRAYGIDKPSAQLLAVHQHNESEAAQNVVRRLQQGLGVAGVFAGNRIHQAQHMQGAQADVAQVANRRGHDVERARRIMLRRRGLVGGVQGGSKRSAQWVSSKK